MGLYSIAVAWAETLFFLPNALPPCRGRTSCGPLAKGGATGRGRVPRVMAVTASWHGHRDHAPLLCAGVFGRPSRASVDDLRVLVLGGFGIGALKPAGERPHRAGPPTAGERRHSVAFVTIIALDLS